MKKMELNTIIYEKKGNIALVTLNRPKTLNATNRQMWRDLSQVMDEIEKDNEVKVMIITGITVQTRKGERRTFSTGADLKESEKRTVEKYRKYLQFLQEISLRLIRFPKPTIAAINGYAIGSGYELALACDIRIAAKDAIIRLPEAEVSSSATGGAIKLLPELIGLGRAKEIMFTCQKITGEEAEKIGLVNKAVPFENLMSITLEMAKMISKNSLFSIKLMKGSLDFARNHSLGETMKEEVEVCLKTVFDLQKRKEAIEQFKKRSS